MALRVFALIVALASAFARATAQDAAPAPQVAPTPPPALARALAAHPYFARISYEFAGIAPYLFLIQKPALEEPAYAARVAAHHALLLDPALEAFERLVIRPLGLIGRDLVRDPSAQFLVVILASEGDYANYLAGIGGFPHHGVSSSYDPELDAAVLHESPSGTPRAPAERARSARHALTHVLEQSHASGVGRTPPRVWLFEGLATFLAGIEPERKIALVPDPATLVELAREAGDVSFGPLALRSLEEMFAIEEGARVAAYLRAERPAIPSADPARLARAFERQAGLLVFYLHEGEGGRLRPSLHQLLFKAFRGEPGSALRDAFMAQASPTLEQDFRRWLIQAIGRARPGQTIPVETLLGRTPSEVSAAIAAPEVNAAPALPDLASARAALHLEDARPAERFALALWNVRQGRADEGRAELEHLLAGELAGDFSGDLRARIEREAARLAAWITARDEFLQHLIASQQDLELMHDGKRVRVKLARIEGDTEGDIQERTLCFLPGRSGLERLPLDALEPLALAQQMDAERAGWIRAYGYVVSGDERGKRLLKNDPPEARALREEAGEYAAILRTGELATLLLELAARPEARTPAEAEHWLADLAALRVDGAGLELVERKGRALRDLGAEIAGALFDLQTPWSQLHGRIEPGDVPGDVSGEESILRVTYEFDDPAELLDFEPVSYLEHYREEALEGEHADAFALEQGELRGSGAACLRSLFDVGAPLHVRYVLALDEPATGCWLNLGILDDRKQHFAWALDFHHLQVWGPTGESAAHAENPLYYAGRDYTVELHADGTRVTLTCDGVQQQELPNAGLRSGALFLWLHCASRARIERLEIRGRFGSRPPSRLRQAWIERELATRFPHDAR